MSMLRVFCSSLLLILATASLADEAPVARILVTFDDPGMSRSARAGPVRPGYRRQGSTYLVSADVRRAARRLEQQFSMRLLDEWPIDPLKVHCIVYAIDATRDVDELLESLRRHPKVESAQRMNNFEVLGDTGPQSADPYVGLQHSISSLHITAAHRWSRGDGSKVAIIDTGADVRHPDLRAQIDVRLDFVGDHVDEFEADAHGTAIAGIIGASSDNGIGIVGVAPSAELSILRACWYEDRNEAAVCDTFTLAKALSFAIESPAKVINLSLGGPPDPLLARLVQEALSAGKIVVAAAPLITADGAFPAGIAGVIVADAIERQTGAATGSTVFAPGDDILVAIPGGGFDYASGSSLSAAHVTGIVALLVSRQPALTPAAAGALLIDAGDPAHGSVSACRALARLLGETGCGTPEFPADGRY